MKGRSYRSLLAIAMLAVLGGGTLYLSYELGRYRAGFAKRDARRAQDLLAGQVAESDAVIEGLRRELAIVRTAQEIDRTTYSQVEADLKAQQAKIQEQEEELAFYRGIMSPADGSAGLRVQELALEPGDSPGQHLLRMILVQAIVHNQRVSGTVRVSVKGKVGEEPFELREPAEIAYDFRYFQDLTQILELPTDLEPATLEVEIRPREPRGDPVSQSFEWTAVAR